MAADSIKNEGVVWTVGTLRSKEEDVLERDGAKEGSTNIKIRDEPVS